MEYNPNIYSSYEESRDLVSSGGQGEVKVNQKVLKQYGKFERKNLQTGWTDQRGALAVFLVASVLEKKNKRLLKEAQGMDDVVQVLLPLAYQLHIRLLHAQLFYLTNMRHFSLFGNLYLDLG